MLNTPLGVLAIGVVSPVGLDAASACAAFRAKLTNPTQTRFVDAAGEPIMAHKVPLESGSVGDARLVEMAAAAIAQITRPNVPMEQIPLLLCVSELERPGRPPSLDQQLLKKLEQTVGERFSPRSRVIAGGRVSVAVAMEMACSLVYEHAVPAVLIVAVDSLLSWTTITNYEQRGRVLTSDNSDGFMPGEGAGALLVGKPNEHTAMVCVGAGFAMEDAHVDSEQPLRADGLASAMKSALTGAACDMGDIDLRITDLSGEQYYFREATLALARVLRRTKESLDLWHPAECTGESGAAAGVFIVALADAAFRKGYAPGPKIMAHMSADGGARAALIMQGVAA
jgi:3-oxoacyl-[acyl-carrier-protein] synthase-1